DFSLYKANTVKRRIMRRVLLSNSGTVKKYLALLRKDDGESDTLYRDLLINFTCFFRDSDTHEYLRKNLYADLLQGKTARDPLRIWVVACSTGEEAYSIIMSLHEISGKKAPGQNIQVFATDLSASAIDKARKG